MPLVNELEMLNKAYKEGYAVGAFNINNMETIQGIVEAAKIEKSPIILQVSRGARNYANPIYLKKLVEAAVEDSGLPIALHLDHGDTFETCKDCIDGGFTSVMIDGSSLPYEENVALTRKVVEYAHAHVPYVTVEGELGTLAGVEDEINVLHSSYTDPNQVEDFVKRTGVDSLAIAIGTSHGAFKFKPGTKPMLRFDILEEVSKRLPGFPIVLHGASSVLEDYVAMFKECGGEMKDAIGVPEELLSKASKMAVCKINIDSDIRLACYAPMRKYMLDNPSVFDPRKPLGVAREHIIKAVSHKMRDVLHSSNKA